MILFAVSLLLGQLLSAWLRLGAAAALTLDLSWLVVAATSGARRLEPALRCLAGLALGLWTATRILDPPGTGCFLPPTEGVKQWIETEVEDAPTALPDGIRLRVAARTDAGAAAQPVCGSVLLTITGASDALEIGDRLRLHVSLRRPRNFANPRAYDQVAMLARQGIWVTAHATSEGIQRLGREARGWSARIARERARIGRLIDAALPPPEASLLRSLVVGDEASVPAELWDQITRAGLAHLLSVSGLHIALVWGLVFGVLRWCLSRSERLLLQTHVRALAAVAALPGAVLYGLLAGLSVPAARSVAMAAFCVVSLAVGREVKPVRVLCLSAVAIAVMRPGSPLEVSFQLSFAAVLALIVVGEWWSKRRRHAALADRRPRLRDRVTLAFVVPAAALVGTAPLVALHFNRFTPIGLITNPVLVPLSGTPATVLGICGAAASLVSEETGRAVFALAYWPLALLRFGVASSASLPLASVRVPTPTLLEIVLLYALLEIFWLPPPWRRRLAAAAAILLLADAAWWTHERLLHGDLRVRFLDVGQGDAAVVELPGGKVLVVDGGGFGRSRFDVGERVVAPYLWSRRILRADVLVATHGDWDHQGGLHFLAREFAPRELWVSGREGERERLRRLEEEVEVGGGVVRVLSPGETALEARGLRVECLHPPADAPLSANDSSLVLRLSFGRSAFLFTGDIESASEGVIVESGEGGPLSVLKVPHHGSATSSSERFLRWAPPEIAVMSLGLGNVYGFPAPSVLRRYRRLGASVLRTDLDGSVGVSSDGRRLRAWPHGSASAVFCSALGILC